VGLEALEHLVAPVLVDRDLVGDANPLGALVVLEVEDLLVERGRVVDDDQDLGLRVEVGPGLVEQLLDLVEVVLLRSDDPILQTGEPALGLPRTGAVPSATLRPG
jgi:hypothetical protein